MKNEKVRLRKYGKIENKDPYINKYLLLLEKATKEETVNIINKIYEDGFIDGNVEGLSEKEN